MKCFFVQETELARKELRRYSRTIYLTNPDGSYLLDDKNCAQLSPDNQKCPGKFGYHNADFVLGTVKRTADERKSAVADDEIPHDDPRWPKKCDHCDYLFAPEDHWQINHIQWYRDFDNKLYVLREMPPGAMWDAYWMPDNWKGPDGRSLHVVLPNGHEWCIDGRASNCTKPDDKVHRCWVRHGEPPNLTVDKNGNTCAAGAGSILSGDFHGFLRNGYLEG